jgi:hypothetical protein
MKFIKKELGIDFVGKIFPSLKQTYKDIEIVPWGLTMFDGPTPREEIAEEEWFCSYSSFS